MNDEERKAFLKTQFDDNALRQTAALMLIKINVSEDFACLCDCYIFQTFLADICIFTQYSDIVTF